MIKATIITEGQSILDVALQEAGTIDAAFELADAAGLAITDVLEPGQILTLPTSSIAKPEVVGYYARRSYRVNTGDITPPTPLASAQGYFSTLFFTSDSFA